MLTIQQVNHLRTLHDAEQEAYYNTIEDGSEQAYEAWKKVCIELNEYIKAITVEE